MDIKVYSIGCPACNVLEKKLKQKGITYRTIDDEDIFKELGIDQFPFLQIDNGPLMNYKKAVEWVNNQ